MIEPVLAEIRRRPELTERSPGTFYKKSQAFLHFHEDPAGLFADVRLSPGADFTRMRVSTKAEQRDVPDGSSQRPRGLNGAVRAHRDRWHANSVSVGSPRREVAR